MPHDDDSLDDDPHLRGLAQVMRDQQARQTRLRHVQEFLTTPAFLDLSEMAVEVSDDPAVLADRRRDLDYRIGVLKSVLALLEDERRLLDRAAPDPGSGAGQE